MCYTYIHGSNPNKTKEENKMVVGIITLVLFLGLILATMSVR
jgi:hypothetical protein